MFIACFAYGCFRVCCFVLWFVTLLLIFAFRMINSVGELYLHCSDLFLVCVLGVGYFVLRVCVCYGGFVFCSICLCCLFACFVGLLLFCGYYMVLVLIVCCVCVWLVLVGLFMCWLFAGFIVCCCWDDVCWLFMFAWTVCVSCLIVLYIEFILVLWFVVFVVFGLRLNRCLPFVGDCF